MFQSLQDRSVGRKRSPIAFQHSAASSPDLVERLELRTQLEGHTGCVNTVCFSDDGELLVSGSDDQRVMLWNWYSGTLLPPSGNSSRPAISLLQQLIYFLEEIEVISALPTSCPHFGNNSMPAGTRVMSYVSGHHNNIFQARPLPHTANSTIVTCAADGQVRRVSLAMRRLYF